MKELDSDPTRWRDSDPGAGARAARAGVLARRVPEPTLPGPAAMDAIRARVVLRRGPRARASRGVRRSLVGIMAAALLIFGAILGAAAHSWVSARRAAVQAPAEAPPVALSPRAARTRQREVRARVALSDDEVTPSPSEASVSGAAVPAAREPAAPPAAPISTRRSSLRLAPTPALAPAAASTRAVPEAAAVPAPVSRSEGPSNGDGVHNESRALGIALQKLRRAHDARGALDALDAYGTSFPNGRLQSEAGLVRVEALLALNERAGALRWLDRAPLDGGPRSRELLVLRGELRAAASRCAEAVKDLGRGLSAVPADAVDERALFARASCFTRLHQFAAARGELDRYAAHFPNGPHAAEAARIVRTLHE